MSSIQRSSALARHLKWRIVRRSKWLIVADLIAKNQRTRWAARQRTALTTSGATHSSLSLEQSVAYIGSVFDDYIRYGELDRSDLDARSVLELGPGDNFGVSLRFLAEGAERVTCVDRFATPRDEAQQRRIYEALLRALDRNARESVQEAIHLDREISFDNERLRPIEGIAVEEIGELFEPGSFDLIVSRAVLEHIYDPDAAFAAMDRILVPGGLMLHKVDFRDHGMFSSHGMHPLTFLTVPEPIYRWMTNHSGRPNRRLADWYRAKLDALGYESRLLATKLVGGEELEPHPERIVLDPSRDSETLELLDAIRSHLRPRYESLDDRDLAVAGIFIVARKPTAEPAAQPAGTETGAGRSEST